MNTSGGHPHYIYDLSLPLPDRKLKRMYFPTGLAAANFLAVPPQKIYSARRHKTRVWSEALQGWFAVRIAQTEIELL